VFSPVEAQLASSASEAAAIRVRMKHCIAILSIMNG
jgi:hypothetical protein